MFTVTQKVQKNSTSKFDLGLGQGPSRGTPDSKRKFLCGKPILHQSGATLKCFGVVQFLLLSLCLYKWPSWQLRSGWGYPAISCTLTQVICVYFRTICVFIYKRSWLEHAPACRFQTPRPRDWAHPLHSTSKPIQKYVFPLPVLFLLVCLVLPVWSYNALLRLPILIVTEAQTAPVSSKGHLPLKHIRWASTVPVKTSTINTLHYKHTKTSKKRQKFKKLQTHW